MSSKQSALWRSELAHTPPGSVPLSQALPMDVHRPKNQTVFLTEKAALILLVGDIPKPLSLAPVTERFDSAENGKEFINRRPVAAFTKKETYIMEERSRKHRFTLRLSDDEARILEGKFKLSGMRSRSAFLRQLLIEGFVYDVDYSYLREYNVGLAKIGTNINQIAHRINETRSIYQTDINEIKKEMEKLWQLQKSMLSRQPYLEQ